MKIYIGNLGIDGCITSDDLRPLFEQYGTVLECEVIRNYAFVHIDNNLDGEKAVSELNGYNLNGRTLKVEKSESKGPRRPSQKIFVGNLSDRTTDADLREIFERYARVIEADVISNFGFVHVDSDIGHNKINEILRELNGYKLHGVPIRVQLSTSNRNRDGQKSKRDFNDSLDGFRGGGSILSRIGGGSMRGPSSYDYREAASGINYRGDPYPTTSYMRERLLAGVGDEYGRDANLYERNFRPTGVHPMHSYGNSATERGGSLIPVTIGAPAHGHGEMGIYDHRRDLHIRGGGIPPQSMSHYGSNPVLREIVGGPGPIRTHDQYLARDMYSTPGGYPAYSAVPGIPGSQLTYYNSPVAPAPHMELYGRRSPVNNPYVSARSAVGPGAFGSSAHHGGGGGSHGQPAIYADAIRGGSSGGGIYGIF